MIVTIVSNIVSAMNSHANGFIFDFGWGEWQNKIVDEFDREKGLVLLDSESTFSPRVTNSGRQVVNDKPILFFAFKSELDWTPTQHDTNCIIPARVAMREFVTRCENDNENIDSIKYSGEGRSVYNAFDVNVSGVLITLDIELIENPPICF